MKKGIQLDDARAVLRNCLESGIAFHIFSILGFPEETSVHAYETLAFFQKEAAVICHPHNSFDIHPFTLDLRTEYTHTPEQFGIEIDEVDLAARDFPLSVAQWENTRGISQSMMLRLLKEFHAELRNTFRVFHPYPMHIWPDWGTYSILYADYYEDRLFLYRMTLPEDDDPLRFCLRWTESVCIEESTGGYNIRCITGSGRINAAILGLLAKPQEFMAVTPLLARLSHQLDPFAFHEATRQELRTVIDQLLLIGALYLAPESRQDSEEEQHRSNTIPQTV
jgi:hypothetical protein